jgi:PAS domain
VGANFPHSDSASGATIVAVLRTHLVLEEQRKLFDVWQQASIGAPFPSRSQIQLRCFGPLLPFISLIEQSSSGELTVRMAGSSLRDVFGGNPEKALQCSQCPSAERAILEAFATGRPQAGSCPQAMRQQAGTRFWLRLPLGSANRVEAVLGLDVALRGIRAPQWALEQMSVTA